MSDLFHFIVSDFTALCMACIVHSVLPEQLLVPAYGRKKNYILENHFWTRGIML